MPTKPTRSNLMRRPRTADVPPICKSKDDATGIVSVCDCPQCDNCEQIEFYDGQFDDMIQFIDDQTDQCGAWSWDGDEDNPPDSGEFNNCIPKTEGRGLAFIFECNGVFSGTFPADPITYINWLALLQSTFPHGWFWTGTWTDNSSGQSFPTNGNNCP